MTLIPEEQLQEWERVAEAATPNLIWGWAPNENSTESPAEYMARTVKPESTRIRAVWSGDDDPAVLVRIVAFVGDGPTSDANAEYIATGREALLQLINSHRELRAIRDDIADQRDSLQHQVEAATHTIAVERKRADTAEAKWAAAQGDIVRLLSAWDTGHLSNVDLLAGLRKVVE